MPDDTSPPSATFRSTLEDGLLVLQLDDPGGFPRLTRVVLAELLRQFTAAATTSEVRAIVLSGTAKCFAAGAEISQVGALGALEALRFSALGQGVMRKIARSPKPAVAAIRGYCLGGGLDLALACQLRVASDDAIFGHPGAGLGIITGWGGTQRLPRLLLPGGRARTREMVITAQTLTAGEAYAAGLVHRVVPPGNVLEVASSMARAARIAP